MSINKETETKPCYIQNVVLSFAPTSKINVNKCLHIETLCLYLFT